MLGLSDICSHNWLYYILAENICTRTSKEKPIKIQNKRIAWIELHFQKQTKQFSHNTNLEYEKGNIITVL